MISAEQKNRAVGLLRTESCSCVVCTTAGELLIGRERGVADLRRLLAEDPGTLRGAFIADKVVGKAAAALMLLGGVEALRAETISDLALGLLHGRGIEVDYGLRVPHIINRTRTGWCPLESRCRDLRTPEECLAAIDTFLHERHTATEARHSESETRHR